MRLVPSASHQREWQLKHQDGLDHGELPGASALARSRNPTEMAVIQAKHIQLNSSTAYAASQCSTM